MKSTGNCIPPFVVLSHDDQALSPSLGPLALLYQATGPPSRELDGRSYVFLCNLRGELQQPCCYQEHSARTTDSVDTTTDSREALAHPITDHDRDTFHWVDIVVPVPVPSLCTLLHVDPIASSYYNVHYRPLTRSVAALPLFFFLFWMAHRDLTSALVTVLSLRNSSFFYNLHDCPFLPLQPFPLLSSADRTFSFRESVPPRNLPLLP